MEIMKNLKNPAFFLIIALGMASCSLFNVSVDTTMSGALDVYVNEGMAKAALDGYDFNESTPISPDEAEDYSDRIKDLTVNRVLAEVDSVSQAGVILLAGTTFYITNGVETVDWEKGGDWPIQKGTKVTLEDVENEYAEAAIMIKNAVENGGDLTIGTYGQSSKQGVYFRITLYIETTVEASLL